LGQLADDALGNIADGIHRADHRVLANDHIIEQALELRRHPWVDQRWIGLLENTVQREDGFRGDDVLALGDQKVLLFQAGDDLRTCRRRADTLGFLEAVPKDFVVSEAPGIPDRLDQRALVVAGRGRVSLPSIIGSRSCAVSPSRFGGSNCASSPFSSAGCHSGECRPPAQVYGLPTGCLERKASDIERCGRLPVPEIRHESREIGPRDDIEQLLFVNRKAWPDFPQGVSCVDVWNDCVMARAIESLVVKMTAGAAADDRRVRDRDRLEGLPDLKCGSRTEKSASSQSGRSMGPHNRRLRQAPRLRQCN
jgi:hypothetical protein